MRLIHARQLTAPGRGAIAVIELVGEAPAIAALLARHFEPAGGACAFSLAPGRIATGVWCVTGKPLDTALVVVTDAPQPASRARVELHLHGSPLLVTRVLEAIAAAVPAGSDDPAVSVARTGPAEPHARTIPATALDPARPPSDPFAPLAVLPALLDAALARAATPYAAQVWLRQAHGALAAAIDAVIAALADERPADARLTLGRLRTNAPLGRALLVPPRVALIGRPNAGKSTLLNALFGGDRVIVDPQPGTTRDAVAVTADLGGIGVTLLDTAGLSKTRERLTRRGVVRALRVARQADLVLLLMAPDAAGPPAATGDAGEAEQTATQSLAARGIPWLLVHTKADLVPDRAVRPQPPGLDAAPALVLSARERTGLDALAHAALDALGIRQAEPEAPVPVPALHPWLQAAEQATHAATSGEPGSGPAAAAETRATVREFVAASTAARHAAS